MDESQTPGIRHKRNKNHSGWVQHETYAPAFTGFRDRIKMKTLLALEPRILFDGAALVTGAEVIQDQTSQDQSIPGPDANAETSPSDNKTTDSDAVWSAGLSLATSTNRREMVFIDTRVEDYQNLMEGIDPAAEVILLDARRDGIEQIAEALKDRSDMDAIHLIGDGTDAELHLGTTFLTQEAISGRYANLFTQIGQSLSAEADLLIYGCNFGRGQAGLSAMQTLAGLTGADIAASRDRTGHFSEYANWELEVATGLIETSIVIGEATQAAWEGVLATFSVTNTNDSGAGSLRQALIDAKAAPGTDTIIIPTGTYVLTTGKLNIDDTVIITGAGAATTIIDGNANERVFETKGSNTVTVSGVTIQNGRESSNGAGVLVDNSSILNLSDSVLTNNNGTGGEGGAFHVHGTLNLNRVLIANNLADKGAGIYFHNADGGTLTNVTFSGNTAVDEGGGVWTNTPITVINSTFTLNNANDAGGIFSNGVLVQISNTIVSGNTASSANDDVLGNFSSSGYNLIEVVGGATGFGSDITGVSANLGVLADNGGPTRTHALLAGSPALNAGTPTGAPAVDQRGLTRDAAPDIGAYEYKSSSFVSKNEFTVNDPSGNNEMTSGPVRGAERAVDIAPNGDYVVVWTNGTANDKVYAKVLDASGNQKVAQFQVNIGGGTNNWTDVAVDDSGNFVVAWNQDNDIYMRRFLANGTAVDAGGVMVNTITTNTQQNSSVNMNGAGDFVIAWEGDGGGTEGIFVRKGSFAGGLVGSDITVNTAAAAKDPSVGIDDSGNFVVVWDNGSDVFFQLYNSAGIPQNSGQVDVFLQLNAGAAAVDMSGDGRFTVAYQASVLSVDGYARQFDATGNALFLPKTVNTSFLGTQTNPSVTMDDIGEFIVVWEGAGDRPAQNDTAGVFGQKFNSSGQKIGVEFLINQTTVNVQDRASVAMLDRDNFVAVWTGSDGAQTDIFARQYGATTSPTLDLDANDSSGATGNDYAFTFTEGDGPTAIADSDTDLTDVDSTSFAYMTVSLSGLLDGNAEVLILDGDTFALATDAPGQDTSGGNYHARVSSGAGTAIITIIKQSGGTFSEVEAETLIKAIQYQHTDTSAPTDGDRLIEVHVNDGTTDSAAARTTINIDPVNDAPSITTNTGTTVNEGSTGNIISTAMLNEGDPDDAGTGLTYTVTAVTTNGTLRLSGTALGLNDTFTQDDIDTNRVTYDHNGSETTTDAFNFSLADGGENGATPATGTFTITVTPANDPPVFSGLDNTPTFTEGGAAVVLDNNATIADIELDTANNYNGATLMLVRNGGANGNDVFNGSGTLNSLVESGSLVVGGTTIGTVTTNSGGTLVLTFNGNATTARVNSALQQITYANTNGTPPPSVQIDFTINDGNSGGQGTGGALNGTGSITVTITPTNTAPTIDLDANDSSGATGNDYQFTFTEGDGPTAIADNDTDMVDVDSTTFTSVKLAVSGLLDGNAETLVLDGNTFALNTAVAGQDTTGGNYQVIVATGAGTATVTITKQGGGTFTEVQTETLIKAIQYQHTDTNAPTDGNRLIDVIVNDGTTDSAAARTTINVNPVNDGPTATIAPFSYGVNEDDLYRAIGGVSVSDIDAGTNNLSVTLSVNDGLLRLVTTTGLTFASGANDSATMTVTGTTTNLNNALATLRYQPDPDFAGTDLLTLSVDDLGNTGGGSLTAMDTANIIVAPINDSPSFTGLNQTPTFIQGGPAVVLDNNATIADPELDAANNYNGATLTLARNGGANADDLFNGSGTLLPLVESGSLVVDGTTIGTVTTNSGGTLVLTFNNNASTALVNSALQQLTYANSSGAPPASVQIDFTIDDGNAGSQGSGGALTDTGSITVTINATNIPPVAVADGFTVTRGSTTILNLAGNDLDPDDGLDLTSITIVTGPTNGTIDSINPDGTVTYTHNGTATVTDSFTYTINDLAAATSNTVTVSLVVNLLNVPPVALADSFTVNEGATTTLNLAMNDIDLDDGLDLTSITIVAGPTNGTMASINTDGTVTYTHNGSETLADSFTYTIRDLAGATSNTVTVSLTVTPVNDAPIITSNGGGSSANVGVTEGTTAVTDVNASDAEGTTPTYSIIGGADAALFRIDPVTGVVTFITPPNFNSPGDVGADNVYDVIVQASDGTAVDTQALAVTVTQANVPPPIFNPPPPDPPPSSDPQPRETGGEAAEDQAPVTGGSIDPSLPGNLPGGGQGSPTNGPRDSDTGNNLAQQELPAKQQGGEGTGIVERVSDIMGFLQKSLDMTVLKDEIRSLLTRHRFLQDLDRVRDDVQDATATEQTYVASSIAVSTGMSIGYVMWLLRSGVLLTALLSSVPAWQFVNPLLVLDAAAKKKRQRGQKEVEGDSVESLFEKPAASAEIAEENTGDHAKTSRTWWFRRNTR